MTYTEIQEKKGKKYYYRVKSIKKDKKELSEIDLEILKAETLSQVLLDQLRFLVDKSMLWGLYSSVFVKCCEVMDFSKYEESTSQGLLHNIKQGNYDNPPVWVTSMIAKLQPLEYIAIKLQGVRFFFYVELQVKQLSELE